MQGYAQECPAVRENDAYALVGGGGNRETRIPYALLECSENLRAVCFYIVRAFNFDAQLARFLGGAQRGDEIRESAPLAVRFCGGDEEFHREIRGSSSH